MEPSKTAPDLAELVSRLDALERDHQALVLQAGRLSESNRAFRRLAGLAEALGLVAVFVAAARPEGPSRFDSVEARGFILKDAAGRSARPAGDRPG
ncbi:MAG: hypothetical protein U0835_26010 [Isosphaeraceae bacterium]